MQVVAIRGGLVSVFDESRCFSRTGEIHSGHYC